jgi:peptide/nickel transport system ATP-binding protein
MSLLKVNQLTVMRGEDVALVDNVSLTLEAGEMLGLVGESGSGKP